MPGGLPGHRQSQFPNDLPPTLFSPASPKTKDPESTKPTQSVKTQKDMDAQSMASQSTFSSSISLIKKRLSNKTKDKSADKDSKKKVFWNREPLPKDPISPRARTAEAYMYIAQFK